MKIIEKYIEQENGSDKLYYDKWSKRYYRNQITKGYEERDEFDSDESYEILKNILITKTKKVYGKQNVKI